MRIRFFGLFTSPLISPGRLMPRGTARPTVLCATQCNCTKCAALSALHRRVEEAAVTFHYSNDIIIIDGIVVYSLMAVVPPVIKWLIAAATPH